MTQTLTPKAAYRAGIALMLASSLAACATSTRSDGEFRGDDTMTVNQAVATPVNDVGLDKIDIPTYLADMTDPYADTPSSCSSITTEIARLDDLLGEDLDVPEDEAELREQRALNATSATIGSVLIPFRGVVRAVSGAAENEREAREAYQRGLVRRGYLKGRGEALGCSL